MILVQVLKKYLPLDIMGGCSTVPTIPKCERGYHNPSECWAELGRTYKFYLAIENNDCSDYITEKSWMNAFRNNMVPLVRSTLLLAVFLWFYVSFLERNDVDFEMMMMVCSGLGEVCKLYREPS